MLADVRLGFDDLADSGDFGGPFEHEIAAEQIPSHLDSGAEVERLSQALQGTRRGWLGSFPGCPPGAAHGVAEPRR